MARRSVIRVDLAEAVYQQGVVTKDYAADLLGQVLKMICTTLEKGESAKLSSFVVFTVRTKGKRVGRNPKTNVEVPVEIRRAITFSAPPVLKAHVNRASSLSSGSTGQGSQHLENGHCDNGL